MDIVADALPEKQTVLIVEDSPENITVLGALLRAEYAIRVATGGEKALQMLESDNLPDLILLDIMMPGMDGYEVCRRLKADPRTRDLPVIFITGKSGEEDQVKGFALGAVDYVAKPFSPVIIKARVRTHMELKRLRDVLLSASFQDGLTGIANHRRFTEYLAVQWNMAVRRTLPISLILIDLDDFKVFNDFYGRPEGDTALIRAAQALAGTVKRQTDLVARFGGEKFACILPDVESDGAAKVAGLLQKSLRALEIPNEVAGGGCLTASLGVATVVPSKDFAAEVLLNAADEALLQAKNRGKDQMCNVEVEIQPES